MIVQARVGRDRAAQCDGYRHGGDHDRTGQSKALATTRFMEVMEVMEESVAGLLRDKFPPPGRTLLAAAMIK